MRFLGWRFYTLLLRGNLYANISCSEIVASLCMPVESLKLPSENSVWMDGNCKHETLHLNGKTIAKDIEDNVWTCFRIKTI